MCAVCRCAFLLFIHRNGHSRLVSIFGHGDRRLSDQNTQIITKVDVKLNKWHIAMDKLCTKPTDKWRIAMEKLYTKPIETVKIENPKML